MFTDPAFWRDFWERSVRQYSQLALPVLLAASYDGGWQIDWAAFAVTILVTVGITSAKVVLTTAAGWQSSPDSATWKQLLDRCGSAGLVTLVSFFPADIAHLTDVNWTVVGWMSLMAALTAMATFFADPPTFTQGRHVAGATYPDPPPAPTPEAETDLFRSYAETKLRPAEPEGEGGTQLS